MAQIRVTVSPAAVSLTTATSITFRAAVSGTGNTGVTWSVRESGGGSISSKYGSYTAPAIPGIYHVRATSKASSSAYGESTITVIAPPNATITAAASTTAGQTGLVASVANVPGSGYAWTISGGAITSAANSSSITYSAGNGSGLTLYCTVTNAAGRSASSSKTQAIVPAPFISSFTANKTTLTAGNAVLLTPVFSNGTGSISPNVGNVTSGATIAVTPGATTAYFLTVTNSLGVTTTSSLSVNVVAAPSISSFTATKSTVTAGTGTGLTAVFANGTGIITGVGPVASGSLIPTGNLAASTTFTLTVTNGAGDSVTRALTVNVAAAPVISAFTVSKTTLSDGSSATLNANFTGGLATIDRGIGPITSGTAVSTGPLHNSVTYTLTVTNEAGDSVTRQVSINVVALPAIGEFTAAKSILTTGGATSLNAAFSNGTGSIDNGVGVVVSGTLASTAPLSSTTTFRLTVTNSAGDSTYKDVQVQVVAVPVISSFSASKGTISAGSSTVLTGVFSGGSGVIDNGIGSIASGSSVSTALLSTSTSYRLTVTNEAGDSVTREVVVNVVAVPVISGFTAAKTIVTSGKATTLTAEFTGGFGSIDNGIGSAVSAGSIPTAILFANTTYTLTVTNAAGDSVTRQVPIEVVPTPVITGFTAAKSPITHGKATTLTATFTGGTGSVDNGIGPVVSGNPIPTALLLANTTYTLTVTNAAGESVTQAASVEVVAPPTITGFDAAKNPITDGTNTSLTAIFADGTGTIDNGIGSVASGNPISTSNLSTNSTFTLTVTNSAGDSVTRSITVATVAPPSISIFSASPAGILEGGSSTLTWNATGASFACIDNNIGDVTGTPNISVSPSATTTYTLTVTNQAGTTTTAQVRVHTLGAPVVTLDSLVTSGKSSLIASTSDQGHDVTYAWTVTNGTILAGQGTPVITYSAGMPGALSVSVRAAVQSVEAIGTASATVVEAPIADLFAQAQVFYGSEGILASTPHQPGMTYLWTLTNGTTTGTPTGITGANVVTYSTGSTPGTYQLTVDVQNQAGDYATATRTLSVVKNQFLKDVHTSIQREGHTATTLSNGRVLVAGGNGARVFSSEIFDPATGTWAKAGDMTAVRKGHSATLLKNGKVLIVGGNDLATAEIYDPTTDSWSSAKSMAVARRYHAAVLLDSGKVLVIEGSNSTTRSLSSAELYDPATDTWSNAGNQLGPREKPKAVLLENGKVLTVGNWSNWAELYDPSSNTWSRSANMLAPYRSDPTVTLLMDGKVLVAGGGDTPKPAVNAEVYDPSTNTWSPTGNMVSYLTRRTAIRLQDGKVVVVGGLVSTSQASPSAEIYDPSTNAWSAAGSLSLSRIEHSASLLANGTVLVVGGNSAEAGALASPELFDPVATIWSSAWSSVGRRSGNAASLLPDGKVLVVGGGSDNRVEEFDPSANSWSNAGALTVIRSGFTSTKIPGGSVLVLGGNVIKTENELYNPSTGAWEIVGSLLTARNYHTATLLGNGKVLVAGGQTYSDLNYWPLAGTEVFDPVANTSTHAASMVNARHHHAAVALGTGMILVTGGEAFGALSSAELYNPASNAWSSAGSMSMARNRPSATLLPSGKVLVVGGGSTSAELYDPITNSWSSAGNMSFSRTYGITATLLPDGTVLVASDGTAEIFDPSTNAWSSSGPMASSRGGHSAVILGNGSVVIVGGYPAYIPEFWKK